MRRRTASPAVAGASGADRAKDGEKAECKEKGLHHLHLADVPMSLSLASYQPQKRFCRFHSLSPWRTITTLYCGAMLAVLAGVLVSWRRCCWRLGRR